MVHTLRLRRAERIAADRLGTTSAPEAQAASRDARPLGANGYTTKERWLRHVASSCPRRKPTPVGCRVLRQQGSPLSSASCSRISFNIAATPGAAGPWTSSR